MPRPIKALSYVRESVIERFFVATCEVMGWCALKFASKTMNGLPDRMVLKGIEDAITHYALFHDLDRRDAERDVRAILGMCIEFVELKSPGKKPELHQKRRIEWLRKLGFQVSVIDSKEAVQSWVDE
jgi:hypothetical protein